MNMTFSPKQLEFIRNAFATPVKNGVDFKNRWNAKIGATQCGKTYIDAAFTIPARIMSRRGLPGHIFIIGVSRGTIERNILEPMRELWGADEVGEIGSDNIATLFGENVYCLGAEKASQVAKLRGARAKYAYVDEAVDINEEVFELLKSRLSFKYSCCDFTGNPKDPTNHIKTFLDKQGVDIYSQTWTLADNKFLPKSYVDALKKEYEGTVYYDRYILGKWVRAEGAIYRKFCDRPEDYIVDQRPPLVSMRIGIDFGGNGSAHAFVAGGYTHNFEAFCAADEEVIEKAIDPMQLATSFVDFCKRVFSWYRQPMYAYFDNAEPVLARGLAKAVAASGVPVVLLPASKIAINDRIRLETMMLGSHRFIVCRNCSRLIKSMQQAVWDDKSPIEEKRLDDGSYCVDILDALEYSFEKDRSVIENMCIR